MRAHTLTTVLKFMAACPLVLAVATASWAEQPSGIPNSATVATFQPDNARATVGAYYFAGWYFTARAPDKLAAGLESAIAWAAYQIEFRYTLFPLHPEQTTAERIVLLYAWNEFGEGGYLAPTKGDPDGAYLRAIKQVVTGQRP
jgi:hypothetical protein